MYIYIRLYALHFSLYALHFMLYTVTTVLSSPFMIRANYKLT